MNMTQKQKDMEGRSLRLIAGRLYVKLYNQKLPKNVRDEIRVAHDAACRAFNILEEEQS